MKTKFNKAGQIVKTIAITLLFLISFYGNAQLKGGHILGAMGLQSGTQTPENTLSFYIPGYIYTASSLRNPDGDNIGNPDLTMFITGIGANYVSKFQNFGSQLWSHNFAGRSIQHYSRKLH